jgi:hypothetical protein
VSNASCLLSCVPSARRPLDRIARHLPDGSCSIDPSPRPRRLPDIAVPRKCDYLPLEPRDFRDGADGGLLPGDAPERDSSPSDRRVLRWCEGASYQRAAMSASFVVATGRRFVRMARTGAYASGAALIVPAGVLTVPARRLCCRRGRILCRRRLG